MRSVREFTSLLGCTLLAFAAAGCSGSANGTDSDANGDSEDAVVVDTSSKLARAQYDADVAFANAYKTQCTATNDGKPRVLLTGFGRFLDNQNNATGHILTHVVTKLTYPATEPPPAGQIDPPAPQVAAAQDVVTLAKSGDVHICTLIVPVYWDLAAILIAKELDAFQPNLLVMNGVADDVQPIWLELGSVNRAMSLEDGSNLLDPIGNGTAKLVPAAASADKTKGLLLSYPAVKKAALGAIATHKDDVDADGRVFSDVIQGAELAGFPRDGNTYLCNNVAYVLDYLMAYPGKTTTLLQPSKGGGSGVKIALKHDARTTPRVFVHWPSTLTDGHLDGAADVLTAMVDAQLAALASGAAADKPVVGTNAMAEIQASGATF